MVADREHSRSTCIFIFVDKPKAFGSISSALVVRID